MTADTLDTFRAGLTTDAELDQSIQAFVLPALE